MIHFCVRSNTLIKLMYHSFLYDKCTMNYGHICLQFWFCWIAELPEFIIIETGQIVFGKAHKYYMGLKCLDGYTAVQQKKLARHGFTKGYQILSMELIVWNFDIFPVVHVLRFDCLSKSTILKTLGLQS